MPYDHLILEEDGSIATIRLDRPAARNALSAGLMRDLLAVARDLRPRTDLQAIILTGTSTFFSAGADLRDPERGKRRTDNLLERREHLRLGPDMCKAWEDLEQVTIAAIEGFCVGGGVALAVACDFRIAGTSATLRLPEIPLGMNMSWGAVPRITALVGPSRAKQFVIFGEALDATTADRWGMVDQVVPDGETERVAREWADRVVALPPVPVRMTKQSVNAASGALHMATSFMDRDQFIVASSMEDAKEGPRAFFEKRKGKFTGN